MGDAKRGSSGRGGRRSLGRDFGSCCEEGGFASRRGRSPGYPRKRSRRWVRARRGGWRRRWWSPGTPRRRSGGGGGRGRDGEVLPAARARGFVGGVVRRPGLALRRGGGGGGGGQSEAGRARCGMGGRLRVVTEARVTAGRGGPFYSGPRLPWAHPPPAPFAVAGGGLVALAPWLAGWRLRSRGVRDLASSLLPLLPGEVRRGEV